MGKDNDNRAPELEKILERTTEVLDESKREIFSIGESSRSELENVNQELQLVNQEINEVIDDIDKQQKYNRKARIKLMEVSRDLHQYTEEDIKEAYKKAEDTSVKIAVLQEKEEQLKNRRQELEERIVSLRNTVKKSEQLVSRVGVVRDYLYGELNNLSDHFEDMRQKQKVAIKIIQAQEEERKRVAREIHDGPAQSLANLVFRVELTQKLVDKDLEKAREELEELKGIVRSSVKDVRKIIYDLRPMSLDDLGLIPTLRRYINKFIDQTGICIELKVIGEEKRLPSSHEVTIFRLIQEALNNIYKHAGASNGKVSIEYVNQQINLLITDDGQGFNVNEVEEDNFGIISMRERCDLLNGKLNITSGRNKGTRINILIPIDANRGEIT